MNGRPLTARDLALAIPGEWHVESAPRLLGPPKGVSAVVLDAHPAEVFTRPSEAHILSYVARGERHHRLWFDGKQITDGPLPNRCITIVPAGVSPRAVLSDPVKVTHFYLPHAYLGCKAAELGWHRGMGALEILNPDYRPDEPLVMIAECLTQAIPSYTSADRLYVDSLVTALASRVVQKWSNVAFCTPKHHRGGLASWQMKRACDAMEERIETGVSLESLAAIAGVSPTHFSRAFKQSTGMPPFKWLLHRRIERAKTLLADAPIPIAGVALAVGFSAQPQFTTAFRRATGMTPGAWRRERLT